MKTEASLYVLGLLCLDGDMTAGPVLNRAQLNQTGLALANAVCGDLQVTVGDDETYFKFRLNDSENEIYFHDMKREGLPATVHSVQFGYYHHRAIFRFAFAPQASIHSIRDARDRIHQLVRAHCFDKMAGTIIDGQPDVRINYIYSYPLLVIPQGRRGIDEERQRLRLDGYSQIFSVRSTTFGIALMEAGRRLSPPKHHYVRISVPSTAVYCDGDSMAPDLFDTFIDAIYYGGLYERAKRDYAGHDSGSVVHSNDWTNDLLGSVFSILSSTISPNETDNVGLRVATVGSIVAITLGLVSATLSIVALLAGG